MTEPGYARYYFMPGAKAEDLAARLLEHGITRPAIAGDRIDGGMPPELRDVVFQIGAEILALIGGVRTGELLDATTFNRGLLAYLERRGSVNRIEHAIRMGDGKMLLRADMAEAEYPTERWLPDQQNLGRRVCRRRVLVLEDWQEVPKAGS